MNAILDAIAGFFSARWTQGLLRRKAERSQEPWRAKARAVREVVITSRPEIAKQECHRLLASIGEERAQLADNVVEIVTPATWRSTGCVVRVELTPAPEGTRVTVAAWPGAQLFDWGESRRIASKVTNVLKGHS